MKVRDIVFNIVTIIFTLFLSYIVGVYVIADIIIRIIEYTEIFELNNIAKIIIQILGFFVLPSAVYIIMKYNIGKDFSWDKFT